MTAVLHFGDFLRMSDDQYRRNKVYELQIGYFLRPGEPAIFSIGQQVFKVICQHLEIEPDPLLFDCLEAINHEAISWAIHLEHRGMISNCSRGTGSERLDRVTMLFDVQSAFRSARIGSGNLRPELLLSANRRYWDHKSISLIGVDGSVRATTLKSGLVHYHMEASMPYDEDGRPAGSTDFAAVKRSLWQARLARVLVFMVSGFEYCGSRFGLLRIHEQWGRLFTLNSKTIALECTDDFLSARQAEGTTSLESAARFVADEDNSSHLPETWRRETSSPGRLFAFVRRAAEVLLHAPVTDPLPPVDRSAVYGTSLDLAPCLAFLGSWEEPHVRAGSLPRWPPKSSDNESDTMGVSSDEDIEADVDSTTDVNEPDELPDAREMEVDCSTAGDVQGITKPDFLALPTAIERSEVFLESMQIDDGPTESSMTERSTTVSSYDSLFYYSSHGDHSVTAKQLDQQTEILLSILDKYDVRLVLVPKSEMDELAGMTPVDERP